MPAMLQAFHKINDFSHDADYNKQELILLIYTCVHTYPAVVDLISGDSAGSLMNNHISTRNGHLYENFNASCLPTFYRLLLLICKQSATLTLQLMQHPNTTWGVKTFLLNVDMLPEVSRVLLDMAHHCKTHPMCQGQASIFKKHILTSILSDGILATTPSMSLQLLMLLTDETTEDAGMVIDSQVCVLSPYFPLPTLVDTYLMFNVCALSL